MKAILIATGLTSLALLAGCSSNGESMTLTERWRAMVKWQDDAARGYVDTDDGGKPGDLTGRSERDRFGEGTWRR